MPEEDDDEEMEIDFWGNDADEEMAWSDDDSLSLEWDDLEPIENIGDGESLRRQYVFGIDRL